jgi:phage host-nuclease inhibitor protein Gam
MKNIKMFEDYTAAIEGHNKEYNYMFFQNLHTIKDAIEDILAMDKEKVDSMLSAGHGWALDHMATSVDDIEEVYHFLKNRMGEEEMVQPEEEMTQVEIIEEPGSPEEESDDDKEEGEED